MKIKKITLNNIRSYSSESLILPSGSTLLSGDVGAGKTTILLAIEHAFFGLQPGQRGSSLLSNKEDEGSIILDFEIDNQEITIERKLKRGSKTITQDYASLTINGQKEELSVTELKIKVLNLLGYPEDFLKKTNILYRYTVYSPQEEMKSIILEDPEKRIDLLRHIFGVDKYKNIKDNISIVALKLREKSRLLQSESNMLNDELKRLEDYQIRKEDLGKKQVIFKIELKEKKETHQKKDHEFKEIQKKLFEKQKLETEIEKTNLLITNKKQTLIEKSQDLERIKKDKTQYVVFNEQEYNLLINEIKSSKEYLESLNNELISCTASIQSISSKKEQDFDRRKRIFSIDFCPTCLQNVSENHKHNILNETENDIVSSEKILKELTEKKSILSKNILSLKGKLLDFENTKSRKDIEKARTQDLTVLKEKEQSLEKIIDSTQKDIKILDEHVSNIKSSLLAFSNLDSNIHLKDRERAQALSDENNTEIKLAGISKELEVIDREMQVTINKLAKRQELQDMSQKTSLFEQWLSEDFTSFISNVEKNIMVNVRKEFSRLFNKWFSMLTTDSFSVNLDENFTPVIMQSGFEIDYAYLSGGERTAIALAYRLALNQIINMIHSKIKTKDLLILDEPTDGFSEQQLDKIRDILKELNVAQLIIVSHERKIESFVDNIIKITKDNRSSIQEQKI